MKNLLIYLLICTSIATYAQNDMINAGPMPGYSEMKEAAIWLQTTGPASVYILFWNKEDPSKKYRTNTVQTTEENAWTAILVASNLEPGNIYEYDVYINEENIAFDQPTFFQSQKIWKWRGDPPNFSFLMGCGAYINETKYDRPGKPYGGDYQIYDNMADKKVDFMLWLGDNIYLREPDWNSWSGLIHRYTHDRGIPELQKFLHSTHHYAIWDDHDYGPNDSDRSFWNKNQTRKAFKMFWANPSYGVGNIKGAISFFQWGDADFYMLDNRTYRTPNRLDTNNKTQLGDEQLQWLFDNLASTYSTFKFVVMGGQFLSNSGVYESYTNYGFAEERQKIIDFIYKQNIQNVVFLTGDVHFSEVSVLQEDGKPTIWDITSSPMNSGVNTRALKQNNTLRIPESVIMERNFTQINVTGPVKERKINIIYFDVNGNEIFSHSFEAQYKAPGK